MKKILNISLIALMVLIFGSCAKTRDGLGLDTIQNIVRTGKWTQITKTFYPSATPTVGAATQMVSGGQYAEFKSDKLHFYQADKTEFDAKPYSFLDTKTMNFDGVTYKIEETLGGTIQKMTLVNEGALGRTVILFLR